jgi:hypothetical protein
MSDQNTLPPLPPGASFTPSSTGTVTVSGAGNDLPALPPGASFEAPEPKEKSWTDDFTRLGNLSDAKTSAERMLIGLAKGPAALAEYAGWSQPAKDLMARDEYLKQQSGTGAALSSLAGDVGGFFLPGKTLTEGAQVASKIPQVANLGRKIVGGLEELAPGASKYLEESPGMSKFLDNKYTQAAAGAGAASFLNPTGMDITDPRFAEERKKQMLESMALGPAFTAGASTVGRAIKPQLERLKELAAQGIDVDALVKGNTTLGQILGGGTQAVENFLKAFPLSGLREQGKKGVEVLENLHNARLGELKSAAQGAGDDISKTIDSELNHLAAQRDYNNAILDKGHKETIKNENKALANEVAGYSNPVISNAVAPAGIIIPKHKVGNEAIDYANSRIAEGYENFHNEVGSIPFLKQHKDDLKAFLNPDNLEQFGLTKEAKAKLKDDVTSLINAAGRGKKELDTRVWQSKMGQLGDKAYDARTELTNKNDNRAYANALMELKDRYLKMMEDATGRKDIRQLNAAHSLLQAPTRASTHLKTMLEKEGDFDPQLLIAQLKNDMPQKRFAALQDKRLQEAIVKYQDVAKRKADLAEAQAQRKELLDAAKGINNQKHDAEVAKLKELQLNAKRNVEEEFGGRKEALNEAVNKVKQGSEPSSLINRMGYALTLSPLAKAAAATGSMFGLPGAATASSLLNPLIGAAWGVGPLTRMTYGQMQPTLKKLVTGQRPEALKQFGKQITKNAPGLGALGGASTARQIPADLSYNPQESEEEQQ